ncbi:hypothetical protein HDU93_006945 [Gonapodya sp. JEL0774]|nr:hypothetical protein HDU93_006945 [Gonapodya sp. JEL0774]
MSQEQSNQSKIADALDILLAISPETGSQSGHHGQTYSSNNQTADELQIELCAETLSTLLRNVATHPDLPAGGKFRKVKLSNPLVRDRVLEVRGGRQVLEACGWQQWRDEEHHQDYLVFPGSNALSTSSHLQPLTPENMSSLHAASQLVLARLAFWKDALRDAQNSRRRTEFKAIKESAQRDRKRIEDQMKADKKERLAAFAIEQQTHSLQHTHGVPGTASKDEVHHTVEGHAGYFGGMTTMKDAGIVEE